MKKHIVLILLVLIAATAIYSKKKPKKKKNFQVHFVSNLSKAKSDTVRLKVYIFEAFTCPTCPPGADCKPCPENYLTVVDDKPVDAHLVPVDARLKVYYTRPEELRVGKRYMLTVRFRNRKTNPTDNLELLSQEMLSKK